jgi:predicted Kef-type K+ transport protein
MFQFLGDLLTYIILIGLGVGLIYQYKKKKKDLFLILGILMILINSVMVFNSYQKYQDHELNKRAESKQRVQKNL